MKCKNNFLAILLICFSNNILSFLPNEQATQFCASQPNKLDLDIDKRDSFIHTFSKVGYIFSAIEQWAQENKLAMDQCSQKRLFLEKKRNFLYGISRIPVIDAKFDFANASLNWAKQNAQSDESINSLGKGYQAGLNYFFFNDSFGINNPIIRRNLSNLEKEFSNLDISKLSRLSITNSLIKIFSINIPKNSNKVEYVRGFITSALQDSDLSEISKNIISQLTEYLKIEEVD